jgi:hypothetical protein
MANALYTTAKNRFLTGALNWTSATIKVVLIDKSLYVADVTADEFLSDIPLAARVATSSALTTKTAVGGVASSDNVLIASVTGQVDALVIYQDTGSEASSPLIAYIDTSSGLPILMNNGSFNIQWNTGTAKIFSL